MADVKTLTIHGTTYDIKDANARDSISTLESKVTQAESNINTLEGKATQAESDINTLEGKVTQAESDINTLEGKATQAESDINNLETSIDGFNAFFNLLINPTFAFNHNGQNNFTSAGYTRDMWYADGNNINVSGGTNSGVTISAGTRLRQKFTESNASVPNKLTFYLKTPTHEFTEKITVPYTGTLGDFSVNVLSNNEVDILSNTGGTIERVGLYVGHYDTIDFYYNVTLEQLKLSKYLINVRGIFELHTSWGSTRMSTLNLNIPLQVPLYYNTNVDVRIYYSVLNNTFYGEDLSGSNDIKQEDLNEPQIADNGGTSMTINWTKKDNSDFGISNYWVDGNFVLFAFPKFE